MIFAMFMKISMSLVPFDRDHLDAIVVEMLSNGIGDRTAANAYVLQDMVR
jgi:hypothetical protein